MQSLAVGMRLGQGTKNGDERFRALGDGAEREAGSGEGLGTGSSPLRPEEIIPMNEK